MSNVPQEKFPIIREIYAIFQLTEYMLMLDLPSNQLQGWHSHI